MKKNALSSIRQQIETSEITLPDLVKYYLDQIESTKHLNIYVHVYGEEALTRAKKLQSQFDAGQKMGKLFGAVVSIKDVICYKDHPVSASSKMLEGFHSIFSSTAVERLLKEDAIIIGSTNCDEFAMGSSNEHSHYGPTRNLLDPERVPGGSSGGAAVSIQADTCNIALGSDTGGSVRQPAAFTGTFGMKPSYGRISRHGLIAYASSFDQIGILANHIEDIAKALAVIAGPDQYDSTVSQSTVSNYSAKLDPHKNLKIGYIPEFFDHPNMNPEIKEKNEAFLAEVKRKYSHISVHHFHEMDFLVPSYYVLTTAEASSNLNRYDGIRYGYRSQNISDLQSLYKNSRTEGFGLEVKRRIMLGTFVLSSGYYDAYYEKAQKIRRVIKSVFEEMLAESDIILMPVSMDYPWKIGEMDQDPVAVYLSDVFTVIANICGMPAICLPLSRSGSQLSCGIQAMANRFQEQDLFDFSANMSHLA